MVDRYQVFVQVSRLTDKFINYKYTSVKFRISLSLKQKISELKTIILYGVNR